MRRIRCAGLTVLVAIAALVLGCKESSVPEASESARAFAAPVKTHGPVLEEKPLIALTAKAASTINQLDAGQGMAGPRYLRLRVVPGGCRGFLHKLALDPDVSSDDYFFESGGVKVVVLKRQVEMLRGTQVDYGQEDGKQGFKIQNPNFEGESLKKWLAALKKDNRAE